jgi:hypothetical protein
LGEVDIRFSDRGWRATCGSEFDLRSAFRAGVSRSSLANGCRRCGAGCFEGATKALSVELITSVANIAFSFGDRSNVCFILS